MLTTHSDARGVAAGVIEVFRNVLERSGVAPADVVFLAHSTTQATNALLEGDVAAVGVIGMASRVEALLARGQSSIKEIELAPGRRSAAGASLSDHRCAGLKKRCARPSKSCAPKARRSWSRAAPSAWTTEAAKSW